MFNWINTKGGVWAFLSLLIIGLPSLFYFLKNTEITVEVSPPERSIVPPNSNPPDPDGIDDNKTNIGTKFLQVINESDDKKNGKYLVTYLNKEFMNSFPHNEFNNNTINNPFIHNSTIKFSVKIIIDSISVEKSSYNTGSGINHGIRLSSDIKIQKITKNNSQILFQKIYSYTESLSLNDYSKNKKLRFKEMAEELVKKINFTKLFNRNKTS